MRQVVNGAKGGPLLGHSSCIIRADEQCEEPHKNSSIHEEDDDEFEMMVDESHSSEEIDHQQHKDISNQRKRSCNYAPKTKGPRQQIEKERRLRREIANSNERRRMQSINQGYMSLKRMLPASDSGEKLSKAAVLQNAADYMVRILEERKQLMLRNVELTQALGKQPVKCEEASSGRRKRDMTESSDEGISMSYQPVVNQDSYQPAVTQECYQPNQESTTVIEELRRTVTELRVQLERETQRRALIEQSYTYNLMAAHIPTTVVPLSPPQSRHSSTDEGVERVEYQPSQEMYVDETARSGASPVSAVPTEHHQNFGKASSVASQNLSIIVEAINHLEGDVHRTPSNDKETDSGVSHGESSDEAKSDRSISGTPQPPPAHQPSLLAAISHHRPQSTVPTLQSYSSTAASAPTVPLLYRPTFLSSYISSQQPLLQSPLPSNYIPTSQ